MPGALVDRVRRSLAILLGRSDCVKLIHYQGTDVEFIGVQGVGGPVKFSLGSLKTTHVELIAATESAIQLDNTQYFLCRERDEYPKGTPARDWINQKRIAAMGAILLFASAFQVFVVNPDAAREDLQRALKMIRVLAESMGKGPPPHEARAPPPAASPASPAPSIYRNMIIEKHQTATREPTRSTRGPKYAKRGAARIDPERAAVYSALNELGIAPQDLSE